MNEERIGRLKIVYDKYFYDVYFVCLRITKDDEVALKLQALTFKKLYKLLDNITGDINVKSFLISTCRELSLDHVKRELYAR